MILYHVQADDPEGTNLDWFVVAHNPQQAAELWTAYTEKEGFDNSAGIIRIREILDKIRATRFEGAPRVIEWSKLPIVFETISEGPFA